MLRQRILIVEDDKALAKIVRDNLTYEGFEVKWVTDGRQALADVHSFDPDLVLLDVMLPGMNGFELCSSLRRRGRTPVVFLTAKSQKSDKVMGLDLGADDYITKPFELEEFLARVRAVLRRARPTFDGLHLGDVTIDFAIRIARRGSELLHLTHREFEILEYLAGRPGHIVYRDELLRELWGYQEHVFTRSVDNAIARLRKKIEPDLNRPRFIHTVRGNGYTLSPDGRVPRDADLDR